MKSLSDESAYPSGKGYFPPTVSEMVHNPADPAGKAFFAFEYIGADDVAFCGISWPMVRQFLPAPGMMLVATVTTTPINQATIRDWITIFIHLCGAMMCFVGYIFVEGKTLGWLCIQPPEHGAATFKRGEKCMRTWWLNGIAFWYILFFAIQILLGIPGIPIATADEYSVVDGVMTLTDTASGLFLYLKVLSYASEVFCGVCLIGSHLTIWYFCDERDIDLDNKLQGVQGDYTALES